MAIAAIGSPTLLNVAQLADVVVILAEPRPANRLILIRGECGVGKDFTARALHRASSRHEGPFVKVDCTTRPSHRLASELFGAEKSILGRVGRRRVGSLEFANTGTIYLDELAALPLELVSKLVEALTTGTFVRTGGTNVIHADVQVIASTKACAAAATTSQFWDDNARLNVVRLDIPALSRRKAEIRSLAEVFVTQFNERYHRNVQLSAQTLSLFSQYSWPGNVRELQDMVRRLVVGRDPDPIHQQIELHLAVDRTGA